MSGVYRSTDPTTWDDVDGIIINESAPAANIAGVAANIGILVAEAERGSGDLTEVSSIGEVHELYGKNDNFGLNLALKNKKFGRLKVIRVLPADGVVATKAFNSSAVARITGSAKQGVGVYGNSIQVKIEAGTTSGKKYTIKDTSTYAQYPQEVYDNVLITAAAVALAGSKLVSWVVNSTAAEPDNVAFTALALGADGTAVDADYETAIAKAEVEGAGNFIFLDEYNDARNGYLEAHVANTQDKLAILSHAEGDSVADIVADVAGYRDTDGRIIYAANWVQTLVNGTLVYTSPAAWLASILTQTAPYIDPAYTKNSQFMSGATGLKTSLTRANFIAFKDAGVAAFEYDSDIGIKLKSGVVTQISDTSKLTIIRRRMADYLTNSVAKYLKNFQNAPNSKENRTLVKAAIVSFRTSLENDGILPKDSEMSDGKKASLIDTESANTNDSIAAGFFKIIYKQRLHAAMRYIVISAEIGESVTVSSD